MSTKLITSSQNNRVKLYNALKKKQVREKENKIILEGPRLIEEAVKRNVKAELIFYGQGLQQNYENLLDLLTLQYPKALLLPVSEKVLKQMAATENPQGILAVFSKPVYTYEDIFSKTNPFIIFVDQLQEPGNLGTIIRTAAAAGASGILYVKGTVDPYNPKTLRSTMGGLFYLPVVQVDNLFKYIQDIKQRKFYLIATHPQAKRLYTEPDYRQPTVIIFGNENRGISKIIYGAADITVRVPLLKSIESLNVAICAGIVIYEAVRQRYLL